MASLLIENGTIVNEGRQYVGYIVIDGERISNIGEGGFPEELRNEFQGETIDASGKIVMPGVIDDQVHFREPGLTHKGDIYTESRAAAAGGVTSYMEMPNTNPPTTDLQKWEEKMEFASEKSAVNYSFYLGATNENIDIIRKADNKYIPGIKLFMGSSTGNMLVDDQYALSALFAECPVLIAAHCESEKIIKENIALFKSKYGDAITPQMHPLIRSAEACYRSSAQAVELADKYGCDLHVLHLSTERELSLFDSKPLNEKKITNEVCVHHLWFSDADYKKKGNRIKWNPAIKTIEDRLALREGLISGKVDVVATDHAPHTDKEKANNYWECPSGGPLVQHSLVVMLEMVSQGVLPLTHVVEKMCHAPAVRYKIGERGFLREGSYADIVIVDQGTPWTVDKSNILYKCGWSPFEGVEFSYRVSRTIVNGKVIYDGNKILEKHTAMPLVFRS